MDLEGLGEQLQADLGQLAEVYGEVRVAWRNLRAAQEGIQLPPGLR